MSRIHLRKQPTMYFIGVTTSHSASLKMFPEWARILGLEKAQLLGVDLPLDSPPTLYRRTIELIKDDPFSLGALVTSHKLNVVKYAGDLIEELTQNAALTREVSCLYKRSGKLVGDATDPVMCGRAMEKFLGTDHWCKHEAEVLCFGAGGAGTAILTHFAGLCAPGERPRKLILVDLSTERLRRLEDLLRRLGSNLPVEFICSNDTGLNDRVLAGLPPHSLVINATGMGKDLPGSPISDAGLFPRDGAAWELNYRGDLDFLRQAQSQKLSRGIVVEDGWHYFLINWALIVGLVFDVSVDDAAFVRLAEAVPKSG
jgi:shikimate dehydrogenase